MNRARGLLIVAILGVAAAAVVDVVAPAETRTPAGARVDPGTGTLACPVGTIGTAPAFVHVANVGDEPADVQVQVASDRGGNEFVTFALDAGATRSIRISGKVKGNAAAFVDHAGGRVVASHTVWSRARSARGVAANACARAGEARVVLPHASTRGIDTTFAVANPGTADADVTISLLRDGQRLTPESLTRRVIPPRGRRLFRLSDFVFDAEDATAVLETSSGRIVAESLMASGSGLAILGGMPAGRSVLQPMDATAGVRRFSVAAIGDDEEAGIDARALRREEQGRAPGVPPAIDPSSSVRLNVANRIGDDAVAYAFSVAAGSPIATGATWLRSISGVTDRASIEGAAPARRWAGVLASVQARGDTRMVLANDGDRPARASVTILGGEQPETLEVIVPAGRVVVRRIARGQGTFAASVVSDEPVVMALALNLGGPSNGVAAIIGSALALPDEVAVVRNPRIGVPARLPEGER